MIFYNRGIRGHHKVIKVRFLETIKYDQFLKSYFFSIIYMNIKYFYSFVELQSDSTYLFYVINSSCYYSK